MKIDVLWLFEHASSLKSNNYCYRAIFYDDCAAKDISKLSLLYKY